MNTLMFWKYTAMCPVKLITQKQINHMEKMSKQRRTHIALDEREKGSGRRVKVMVVATASIVSRVDDGDAGGIRRKVVKIRKKEENRI